MKRINLLCLPLLLLATFLSVQAETATSVPQGLSAKDWTSIRRLHQSARDQFHLQEGGLFVARNDGQQWNMAFDGRGFWARPEAGGWEWGLELAAYPERGEARVAGNRLTYVRDAVLEEWFINDGRGLEQGWTFKAKPTGVGDSLSLALVVRGDLRPAVSERTVDFTDAGGGTVLTYGGLRAWDATGRDLVTRFEPDDQGFSVVVEVKGAVYPVTIDPVAQQAFLKASNTEANDQFGFAVAVSGDTAVVGARFEDSAVAGINQGVGQANDNNAEAAGVAYVFVRSNGVWTQQAYLKPAVPRAGNNFGAAVAISGNTIAVGAPGDNSNTTGINSVPNNASAATGAVLVFVRNAGVWTQQAYIKADVVRFFDELGKSVALDGDVLVAGAPGDANSSAGVNPARDTSASRAGAAYVFTRSGTTWVQEAYLKASNPAANAEFGISVGVSGGTAVVGSWFEASGTNTINSIPNSAAPEAGAAYVFERSGSSWSQQAYLKANNAGTGHRFGSSVAISNQTALVGAVWEASQSTGVNGVPNTSGLRNGAAYVFERTGASWEQQAYLKASDSGEVDLFGFAVSISGDLAVVGASGEDSSGFGVGSVPDNLGTNSGAAYLFERKGTEWKQRAFLKASNTGQNDNFGRTVSIQNRTVIVGAPSEASSASGVNQGQDNGATDSGAAYVFTIPPPPIPVTLAHSNYRVPGAVDLFFGAQGAAAVNGGGRILFELGVTGAGASGGRNRVMLSTLGADGLVDLALQRGTVVSGLGGLPVGAKVASLTAPIVNQAGLGIFQVTASGRGVTAASNRLLLKDDGEEVTAVRRTGAAVSELGGVVPSAFREVLQHYTNDLLAVSYTLQRSRPLNVTAKNDSGILLINHAGQVQSFGAREGEPIFGGGGVFGQFTGRAALATGTHVFFIAPFIPTGERKAKQGVFYSNADGSVAFKYGPSQGELAPGTFNGEVLNTFVGVNERDFVSLLRATMKGVSTKQNEGLFNCGSVLLLQKGVPFDPVNLPGVFVTRFLRYWPVDDDQLVVQVVLGGERGAGVTGSNNQALLLLKANGDWQVLLRSGDAAPGAAPATVAKISAVEVDRVNGHYLVLGTLRGALGASNQALWRGQTKLGNDTTEQALRLPRLALRKGEVYQSTITHGGIIKGLVLKPVVDPTGAGARGLGQVVGSGGDAVVTVLGDRKTQELILLSNAE